jgi:hypothetical protein
MVIMHLVGRGNFHFHEKCLRKVLPSLWVMKVDTKGCETVNIGYEFPKPFGGIEYAFPTGSQERFSRCINYLINCDHTHNFAVDRFNLTIYCSDSALNCIQYYEKELLT